MALRAKQTIQNKTVGPEMVSGVAPGLEPLDLGLM